MTEIEIINFLVNHSIVQYHKCGKPVYYGKNYHTIRYTNCIPYRKPKNPQGQTLEKLCTYCKKTIKMNADCCTDHRKGIHPPITAGSKNEKVHKYHHESEATQETKRKRNLAH